jgi:hypothetical protein
VTSGTGEIGENAGVSDEQFHQCFEGLELVEPGVAPSPLWRPVATNVGEPVTIDYYCAVARKP